MAIENMVKSYMKLIGIFRGKQAKHNIRILSILFDNGPLTAWEITGKIRTVGRMSLHATLNKRLRSLEKKGYLRKGGKKWFLQFKGIIAGLLIQKTPKPLSSKWNELLDNYAELFGKHSGAFLGATIRVNDTVINPVETINEARKMLKTFEDWVELSDYVKGLMQTGVLNFDVISNQTLLAVILSEASYEQLQALTKEFYPPAKPAQTFSSADDSKSLPKADHQNKKSTTTTRQ